MPGSLLGRRPIPRMDTKTALCVCLPLAIPFINRLRTMKLIVKSALLREHFGIKEGPRGHKWCFSLLARGSVQVMTDYSLFTPDLQPHRSINMVCFFYVFLKTKTINSISRFSCRPEEDGSSNLPCKASGNPRGTRGAEEEIR